MIALAQIQAVTPDFLVFIGQHIFELLLTAIFASLLKVVNAIKVDLHRKEVEKEQEMRALKEGVQALLRNEMLNLHEQCSANECVTVQDITKFKGMYAPYKGLDGNGVIDSIKETFDTYKVCPDCKL